MAGWRGGALPRPSQWATLSDIPKAQEGRSNNPPDGLAVGNPSEGFPIVHSVCVIGQRDFLTIRPKKNRLSPRHLVGVLFHSLTRTCIKVFILFQELYRFIASSVFPSTMSVAAATAFSMAEQRSFFSGSVNWDNTQSAKL